MKIAQVISTPPFAWATGGCARVAYELSKELVKRGHEVTILTTDLYKHNQRYISPENPEYIDGIKIMRFKYISNWLAWKHKIFISPGLIRYLKNHLKEYDVVHLQDLISIQAVATAKYCKKYDIPYILSTHGSIHWLTEKKWLNLIFSKLGGSNILMNADKITVLNKDEAEECRNYVVNRDKIRIVPNYVDLNEYNNLPQKMEFRKKYAIKEGDQVILYVGRIEKTKGLDLLVKAFASLSKEIDNVMLVIVGPDDGYLNSLRKQVADFGIGSRVIFTGLLEEIDKIKAYVDADVHVSPRAWEPFGVTLIESCACGTPVICSKGCGIADVVDGLAGLAVQYDKDDLKNAIALILSDAKIRQKFSEGGRMIVKDYFNRQKIAEKVENIYLSVGE